MSTSVRPGSPMPVSMPVIESRIIEGDRTAFIPLLLEGDVSRKKRKKVIDQMAAVQILQSYLDYSNRG